MIPRANITAWRSRAPWPANDQVEQDLVLSRALVEMFSVETVAAQAVFRGGTALHMLFFGAGRRYSEDIDLVQRHAGPIGELIGAIRGALDPWLGIPKWKQAQGRFTLFYRGTHRLWQVSRLRNNLRRRNFVGKDSPSAWSDDRHGTITGETSGPGRRRS